MVLNNLFNSENLYDDDGNLLTSGKVELTGSPTVSIAGTTEIEGDVTISNATLNVDTGAEVSSGGALYTTGSPNLAATSVIGTNDITEGNLFSMFDSDITTFTGMRTSKTYNTNIYNYITFDLGTILNNINISMLYSYSAASIGTGTQQATVQYSTNGTSWTDIDTLIGSNSGGEIFKNFSENIEEVRYIRLKDYYFSTSGTTNGARIYNIAIYQK